MRYRSVEYGVRPKTSGIQTWSIQIWSIQTWSAMLLGASLAASNVSNSLAQSTVPDAKAGADRIAFLTQHHSDDSERLEQEAPGAAARTDNTLFDGKWIFTSAGCTNTGSLPAVIRRGKIIVKGGSGFVEPDGTLHSVGAGGGLTLTAVGTLSGNTGSGTFNRSDGCVGTWIGIKR